MFNNDSKIQKAAERLYKAMKGMGTDEATIIAVASEFNADERE